jgi:hypothetical protein
VMTKEEKEGRLELWSEEKKKSDDKGSGTG